MPPLPMASPPKRMIDHPLVIVQRMDCQSPGIKQTMYCAQLVKVAKNFSYGGKHHLTDKKTGVGDHMTMEQEKEDIVRCLNQCRCTFAHCYFILFVNNNPQRCLVLNFWNGSCHFIHRNLPLNGTSSDGTLLAGKHLRIRLFPKFGTREDSTSGSMVDH